MISVGQVRHFLYKGIYIVINKEKGDSFKIYYPNDKQYFVVETKYLEPKTNLHICKLLYFRRNKIYHIREQYLVQDLKLND